MNFTGLKGVEQEFDSLIAFSESFREKEQDFQK